MPKPLAETPLLDFWYAALASEKAGIAISTNDRRLLREQLYRVRSEAGDPKLEALGIAWPDVDGELWIVKKDCLDGLGSN